MSGPNLDMARVVELPFGELFLECIGLCNFVPENCLRNADSVWYLLTPLKLSLQKT